MSISIRQSVPILLCVMAGILTLNPDADRQARAEHGRSKARAALQDLIQRPSHPGAIAAFEATLPRVTLSAGEGHKVDYFVLNGDVPSYGRSIIDYAKRLGRRPPCEEYAKLLSLNQDSAPHFDACREELRLGRPLQETGYLALTLSKPMIERIFREERGREIVMASLKSWNAAALPPAVPPWSELEMSTGSSPDRYRIMFQEDDLKYVLRVMVEVGDMKIPELALNITNDGRWDFWGAKWRALNYAVLRKTFPDTSLYETTVQDLSLAAKDWHNQCPTCTVRFNHKEFHDSVAYMEDLQSLYDQDVAGLEEGLRFSVVYVANDAGYYALAFFPSSPAKERFLWVFPAYFRLAPNVRRGVMRHELGHVLGYRHEHIRMSEQRGLCLWEEGHWVGLSPERDPKSVMHYFCDGPLGELMFSDLDAQFHRTIYGGE